MKICKTCGIEKEPAEFSKCSRSRDGIQTECKICRRAYNVLWRKKNPEKCRKSSLKWARNNPEYKTSWKNRNQWNHKKWDRENPHKLAAHRKVHKAIKTGEIDKQPCEICGTENNIHAHHDDYDQPLDVRWLCHTHHMEYHRQNQSSET